jgi:hypothetical protein
MEAPVELVGNKINCLKCGQRIQVPAAGGAGNENTLFNVRTGSPAPPPMPDDEEEMVNWYPEKWVPVLSWSCYGGIWLCFTANCLAILMPNLGLVIVCGIASLVLTAVTLVMALYTFSASASLWGTKRRGTAIAGLISSTLTTVYCTIVLMCNCGSGAVMVKGIDAVSGAIGGHPAGFRR